MKSFRLLSILAGILALTALTACQEEVEDPFITVEGEKTVHLTEAQATLNVKVTSNRDWGVRLADKAKDWIVVEPSSGKASKTATDVTITVLANTGANRATSIEFYTGTASEMVSIEQDGPEGESDGVESVTVQEFINRADKNTYYRLSGTVSAFKTGKSSSGGDYMQFNLTDETATIVVYGFEGGQYEAWATKIKNNGTVMLRGRYEYYEKNNQHEVVSATVEEFTPGEEQTEITSATVAEFIATASTSIYYRLTGTVSAFKTGKNNSGGDYMQFNLTDETATILVYGFENGQFEEWSTKIKDNGIVTLVGLYQYYEKNSQHEVVSATIESFTEGEAPEAITGTVAETAAAADGASVIITEAMVAAKSKAGLVVADETGAVYLYFDSKQSETVPEVEIGDKVRVEATKTTYGGIPEFTKSTVSKISDGEMTYPEPKDLNPIATTYASAVTEYVTMSGVLKLSGNYVNLEITGVDPDTKQGSVSQPLDALGVSAFDGKEVIVTGYFTGTTGSGKYINVVATSIELADPDLKYCTVSPLALNVKADDTSATIDITSNADWTVTSDNTAFTVSPASGSGNATVTVSFSANEGDAARTANIKVTCAAASVEAVVALTQAKPASGDQTVINIDFTVELAALPQAKANGKTDATVTLEGYDFVMHAEGKTDGADNLFYQAKSGDKFYLLIGKQGAYIQLPVVAGKALSKVAFLTGANASANVIVDLAKEDGTLLNVNSDKLAKGTNYEWPVVCEAGKAYRLVVTNAYNAQFQNLILTYE